MNSALKEKYSDITFTEEQMRFIIEIIKQNKDSIKVLEMITKNTNRKSNPCKSGIIKRDLIRILRENYKKDFSKHAANNALSLLNGSGLIYYEERFGGKPFQLTTRGIDLVAYMEDNNATKHE